MPDDGKPGPDITAMRTALWRAMHVQLDAPPHVFEDEIGLELALPDEGWRDARDVVAPPEAAASASQAPLEASGWYGQRAVILDAAAISILGTGVFLVGRGSGGETSGLAGPLIIGGLGGFALGAPVLHLKNEHPGRAAASLALRLLAGYASVYLLAVHDAGTCNGDNGTDHPGCDKLSLAQLAAMSVPILVAAALDDLVLARGTIPVPASKAAPGAWIAPSAGPGSLSLSVGAAF